MRDLIAAVLQDCLIEGRGFIVHSSIESSMKTLCESIAETKSRWMRFTDPWDIIWGRIQNLTLGGRDDSAPARPFIGSVRPEQVDQLINEIAAYIESIPRAYRVLIRLPNLKGLSPGLIHLSNDLEFLNVDEEEPYAEIRPPKMTYGSQQYGDGGPEHFSRGDTYLAVRVRGFFSRRFDDSAPASALSLAKAALTFGECLGIFWGVPFILPDNYSDTGICIDELVSRASSFLLPNNIARRVAALALAGSVPTVSSSDAIDYSKLIGTIPIEARPKVLQDALGRATVALTGNHSEDLEGVRAASEWLFDSTADDNETSAFLFTSIGLEAILDSPKRETTDRLADRLAYLLGKNPAERRSIANSFREFYGSRSEVVHGRARRLDESARQRLQWAQGILRSVIAHELEPYRT